MNVCVEKPWGKFNLTYQQSRCLKNCAAKHTQLQDMLFKVHQVKAAARPIEYYVDTSDYTGMQALTGRTNPNDKLDTVLHTPLHPLRRQSSAFSSQCSSFLSPPLPSHSLYNLLLLTVSLYAVQFFIFINNSLKAGLPSFLFKPTSRYHTVMRSFEFLFIMLFNAIIAICTELMGVVHSK